MSDISSSRVPKGILKNKPSRFSSAGDGSDVSGDGQSGRSSMNYGQMANTSWESDKGQRGLGVNQSNPKDEGLDRMDTVRLKVGEFISQKADMIFKPLGKEDMPVNDDKGLQRNTEDHYGIVPSLDHFLRVDSNDLRRHFFQNVQRGDIVIGCITSKSQVGLVLKLLCTDGGKHIVLEDLGVKGFCHNNQTIPAVDPRDSNRVYTAGDLVRCEIIDVPGESEKIICGMKGVSLSPEMQHAYLFGLISHYDLPRQFSLAKSDSESRSRRTYEDLLTTSSGFQNPNNVNHLSSSMGIMSNKNTLMSGLRGSFPSREIAIQLRKVQNGRWAHGNVAEGIRFFKLGKYTEAFQALNKALSIDTENVEGLVARGALYANNGSFEKAVEDFEIALKLNPSHFNARKYLAETLVAYGKQLEENGKVDDAVASFSKCLVIRPDHKDARDALLSLHSKTDKIDISKLSGIAATKATELKEKLRTILHSELGVKVDEKSKSRKKKKRADSSASVDGSSSSSSSDSDSDSSSSDSDSYKGKKKKKRKKKSKKSKRSKKASDVKRDMSLSPFSKRLVDPGVGGMPSGTGLAGFSESTYAEWGKQLGIGKPTDRQESEEDNKKSKKKDKKRSKKGKDKRKKKKHASSDNESSSSDSDSSRSKEKRKSKKYIDNQSIEGIIPDLGDLEAKLSAYYSKVEHEKIEALIPPQQTVKVTVEQNLNKHANTNAYDSSFRKIEVVPKEDTKIRQEPNPNMSWTEKDSKMGKIELRTDDYGNFIKSENIVRTVINDHPEQKKFEMKIRGVAPPAPGFTSNALMGASADDNSQSELGSKWRKVGAPTAAASYTVTRPDGSAVVKTIDGVIQNKPGEVVSSGLPSIQRQLPNPLSDDRKPGIVEGKRKEQERNYRGKRESRSRSRSRSPYRPRRSRVSRSRSYSSRSRSRSRGRYSRSRSRSSRSRSRSYSRSPRRSVYPYRGGYRGRGNPTRFFRGYNRPLRRPYMSRPPYRPGGDFRNNNSNRSRFRNRFSHSPSRSRSRSRSRGRHSKSKSRSPNKDRDHGRRRSSPKETKAPSSGAKDVIDITKSPEKSVESKEYSRQQHSEKSDHAVGSDLGKLSAETELQIGSLKTTKAADVEELLDKRNAEKKEEMRKSNPDFFRNA